MKKVYILTGFLGAGKTSFLNYVLKNRRETRYAVIENEIGQIGIDADLIVSEKSELISLNDGCICCSMSNGLYDALSALFDKREEFDEIFIECTGIADVSAVAEPFLSQPEFARFFELRAVIALVDSDNFEEQKNVAPEVLKQIACADVIILTKTDLVSAERLQQLYTQISLLQPFANILNGNQEYFPMTEIFSEEHTNQLHRNPLKSTENITQFRHGDISSVSFHFETLFDANFLINRLQQFVFFQAKDLYRFKAIVACKGEENFIILQSVMKKIHITLGTERNNSTESNFVFIGIGQEKKALFKMLNVCLDRPRIEF
jgi:G3E family GTPase